MSYHGATHPTMARPAWALSCFGLLALLIIVPVHTRAADPLTLEFTDAQTAVLDPVAWDTVTPNERYFDAVRPLLVRFPGVAAALHERQAQGYRIDKLELVLEWDKQEGPRPERGRSGWGAEDLYANSPGQWHVIARALRHPWSVDNPALGPTFNAYLNGAGCWASGGGRGDGTDRSTWVAGPAPLFKPNKPAAAPPATPDLPDAVTALGDPLPPPAPELVARLDMTRLLDDAAFGAAPGARLRALEENGFQVHKLEIRDMKYRSFWAYDWAVGIGYLKIWVKAPRLVVTLRKDAQAARVDPLPPPTDLAALAAKLKAEGGGLPAVRVPADLDARRQAHLRRPDGIPDWEWQRIQELRALGTDPGDVTLHLGRGYNFTSLLAGSREDYLASMRELLRMAPRHWQGHQTSDFAILLAGYPDLLPPAATDHLKLYWKAWLHPEVEDRDNIGGGNQRGGPSYFRGYTHGGGTMNFGHNAVMGALLGAQALDAKFVLKDARGGLDHLVRGWGLGSGAHQEIGDTYYQALTLNSPGAIATFADDPVDRLLARCHRDRLLEPLISMYHPGLRRMTHPMGRGSYAYHLLLQEGPYHILHTLSPSGTLLHLDRLSEKRQGTPSTWGKVHGLSILGDEAPPYRVSLLAPWTEPYLTETIAAMVDNKPLPERIFARDYSPGCRGGGWHVNYLGRNYALASRDNANHDYGITSVVGQWRRRAEQVDDMAELSTLIMSFERNGRFPAPGTNMAEFGIVQRDNKLIALKALPQRDKLETTKESIVAMQSCIAMISFGDVSAREVWVNDRKVDAVSGAKPDPGDDWIKRISTGMQLAADQAPDNPEKDALAIFDEVEKEGKIIEHTSPNKGTVFANDGDIIAIHDGITYLGLIPIVVNPLERTRQVEISYEYPVLQVNAYLYHAVKPLNLDRVYHAAQKPTAGFVVEMGDVSEYPSFAAFRAHLREVRLSVRWNAEKGMAEVACASGKDLLEMGFDPGRYPAVYRRVNGQWPYLANGIMRESCWAIQGSTGRLEKHGAVFTSTPGRQVYLQAVPETGTYIGYNALPDPVDWSLAVPGGVTVTANGKLCLARVVVQPKDGRLFIDHALRPGMKTDGLATALQVFGLAQPPAVVYNDKPYPGNITTAQVDGRQAYIIPLRP